MEPDSNTDLAARIEVLLNWLVQQQFKGVGACGQDANGLRIHIDPSKIEEPTKTTIQLKAGDVPVKFIESSAAHFL